MNDLELVEYQYEGAKLRGRLALPAGPGPHPAVLVMYHALGFDPFVFERARLLASMGYAALATDMYGITSEEQAAGKGGGMFQAMQKDPQLLRGRVLAGYEAIRDHPAVDKTRIGAIGYCFGGQCVLDLARSGADVKAVVSFHGLLVTGLPAEKGQVKAKVLAITGALDPHAPFAGVPAFQQEMIDADADWNMTIYGKGWHAFTDEVVAKRPDIPGVRYDALLDKMSWAEATALLGHVLQPECAA
jgi:dienelactone hydrolase